MFEALHNIYQCNRPSDDAWKSPVLLVTMIDAFAWIAAAAKYASQRGAPQRRCTGCRREHLDRVLGAR